MLPSIAFFRELFFLSSDHFETEILLSIFGFFEISFMLKKLAKTYFKIIRLILNIRFKRLNC